MSQTNGRLLQQAQRMLDNGQIEQAIDTLTRMLGETPDNGDAHALLALCLVARNRLHVARMEAELAAQLDPESLFAHLAMGSVLLARREFVAAERHFLFAVELEPMDDSPHAQLARLYLAWGKEATAMEHARQACELSPDTPGNWALVGLIEFSRGDRTAARLHGVQALELDPEHVDALVLVGHCDLSAGEAESAREHAVWALQSDPTDRGALTLLGAVKARRSPVLGLWWRFQNFISAGSSRRSLLLLVGMYLTYRVVTTALADNGLQPWVTPLSVAWLAFCVYTWFAPSLFWKSVRREMETVVLRPDY